MTDKSNRKYLAILIGIIVLASVFYIYSQQPGAIDGENLDNTGPDNNQTETDNDGTQNTEGELNVPGTTDMSQAQRTQEMVIERNPTLDFNPKDKRIFPGYGIEFTNNLDTKKTIQFRDYDTTIELEPGETKGYVFEEVDKYTISFEDEEGEKIWGTISVMKA